MNQTTKVHGWAFLLPVIAVLIWSLNIAVTRYAVDLISPASISFYRWLIAFIVLTPFMLKPVWRKRHLVRQHMGQLAILSVFGMVLYQGLAYTAAHYTTATNMGIVNAFIPVFTIFVSMLILKEIPNLFAILGSVISFFGLLYILSKGDLSQLAQMGGHWGDLLMMVAVFFYAFYGVFLKKWQLQIPLLISLYVQIGFALIYHIPFLLYFGLDPINAQNAPSLFYAGIFPSLVAPLLWMLAVQQIGPNRTSIFMNLVPVFTAIIASLWLAEQWTIEHSIGGIMILLGIIMAQKKAGRVISQQAP